MALRSLAQLQEQQAALIDDLMMSRGAPGTVSATAPETAAALSVWIARVDVVVAADESLGAHLVVVRQHLAGTPPVPSDAETRSAVAYPVPGLLVTTFSVGKYALVRRVEGTLIATHAG